MISLVVAISKNRVIGDSNTLLWKNELPADMKHFKEITLGHPVIMGRKTYESIGKPLNDRINIVLTRDRNFNAEGCIVVHSTGDAIKIASRDGEEIMVIGGGDIYRQFLPDASKMYLTLVRASFTGDTFFPEYNKAEWKEVADSREDFEPDDENKYSYTFIELERK